MKKKILIGLGVLLVVIILLMATGVLKFSARVGDGGSETVSEDQVKWTEYKNTVLGYTLSHPAAWTVKELAGEGGPDIIISEPQGFAFVRIRALADPAINSAVAIKASIEAYQKSFASQEATLTNFKTGEVEGEVGGFIALGEFKVNDVSYQFEERGLLSTNGRVLIMRASAVPQAFDLVSDMMRQIMDSFAL